MQNLGKLTERLKSQMNQDRVAVENLTQEQLSALGESLRGCVEGELSTIKTNIHDYTRSVNQRLRRAWIVPLLTALSLLAGICGGSWGLTRYLSWNLQRTLTATENAKGELAQAERELKIVKAQTWGIKFRLGEAGERLIVLPRGWKAKPWGVVGQGEPVLELVRE